MVDTQRIHHNYQRMKLLRALLKHKGVRHWVDFDELMLVVDAFGIPMIDDQLDFHLAYCEGHGWVELERGRGERSANQILRARLTVSGLDRIDTGKMPELDDTQKYPRRRTE